MARDGYCPNGCQHLAGLGECGMCGYLGPGVTEAEQDYVIEANEETGRYERIPNPEIEARNHNGARLKPSLIERMKAQQRDRIERIAKGLEEPQREQGLELDDDSRW